MADTRIKDLKNYEGDNNGFMAVDSNMHGTGRLTIKQLSQKIAGGDLTIQVNGASTVYSPVGQAKTVVIDAATHDELQAAERRVEQKVTAETSARESADTELDAKIDTTAENAATALSDAVETLNGSISSVQSNVDAVAADLAHETELRESADGVINDRIDGHIENTANPHAVTAEQVGLGNVDNKSEATIKADFTGEIAEGNEGFVTGGAAYTALGGKQDTLTFDNVPTENSDNPVKSGGVFSEVARLEELIGQTSSFEIVNLTTEDNPVPDVNDPSTKVIYLTKDDSSQETDPYTEWIWTNGNWDIIGTTSIDMSGYATKQDLNTKQDVIEDLSVIRSGASAGATAVQPAAISDMAVKSEMTITAVSGDDTKKTIQLQSGTAQDVLVAHQDISGKADKSEMSITPDSEDATKVTIQLKSDLDTDVLVAHQDISGKQDVIEDLSDIRSGAALGATAYQKPEQGIPTTDLAQAVQDALVPASTQSDAGKILTVALDGAPVWKSDDIVWLTYENDTITLPSGITWEWVRQHPDKVVIQGNCTFHSKQEIPYNPPKLIYQWKDPQNTVLVGFTVVFDAQTPTVPEEIINFTTDLGAVQAVGYLSVNDYVYSLARVDVNGRTYTGADMFTQLNGHVKTSILVEQTNTSSSQIFYPVLPISAYGSPLKYVNLDIGNGTKMITVATDGTITVDNVTNYIQSSSIAPDYSELILPVNAGTRCTYAGYLYTANTTIASGENWNPAHWDMTTVNGEIGALRQVPVSTAQDEGKVLTVDSNGGVVWGQSGFVVTLTEDLTTSPSTLSIDKSFTEINTAIQSSQSIKFNYDKKSPIGTVRVFSGSDVQTVYGSYIAFNCVGSAGKVTSVRLNVSDTVSIVESNNLPTSTSSDEGKVLTVDSNGAPVWTEPPTEIAVFDANYSAPPAPFANYPTFAELNDARLAGKVPIIVQITSTGEHIYYMPTLINVDENQVKFHFVNPETGVILKLEGPTSNPVWSSTTVVGISSYGTRTESGIVDGVLTIYGGNSLTKLKLTTVQSITVKANEGTPNFALEIDNTDNSNDVTVTVVDFADTTLNSSVSGGSTVSAGKYVQLTCVGSCWTLAEFVAPTP